MPTRLVTSNDHPAVRLSHASGSRAEVQLHGAHLTSWCTPDGDERLFVSERASFADGAAIRGGVPVIFPQFGPGPIVRHGFARTRAWTLVEHGDEGAAQARFALHDDSGTRAIWPHAFTAELRIALDEHMTMLLFVQNTGDSPLTFTSALHSYFRVGDVHKASIEGLDRVPYVDQTLGGARISGSLGPLGIREEVDRIYLGAPRALTLRDGARRSLVIRKSGFDDVVVWNPGAERAATLPDLAAEEYRSMLCIEAAQVGTPVTLAPGERWSGWQTLATE